eukprot:scaffold20591_cov185-Skeletonema_menzelii.AAC.1
MKEAVDYIRALWYSPRIVVIPVKTSARQRTWRDVRNTPCTAAFSRFLALTPGVGVNLTPAVGVNSGFTPTAGVNARFTP